MALSGIYFWAWFRKKYPGSQTNFIDITRNPFISCLLNILVVIITSATHIQTFQKDAEFRKKSNLSLSISETKLRCIFIEIVM